VGVAADQGDIVHAREQPTDETAEASRTEDDNLHACGLVFGPVIDVLARRAIGGVGVRGLRHSSHLPHY